MKWGVFKTIACSCKAGMQAKKERGTRIKYFGAFKVRPFKST